MLTGRNAILGSMADSVMTCVVGISEDKALVCSERGDICLLDENQLRLTKIANAEFGVNCITIDADSKFAWIGGKHGQIRYDITFRFRASMNADVVGLVH